MADPFSFPLPGHDLVPNSSPLSGRSWVDALRKAAASGLEPSQQGSMRGRRAHLLDMEAVEATLDFNPYHSTCIEAKVAATVGLGFKDDAVSDELDRYCKTSFLDVIRDACRDFYTFGTGYIENVRNSEGMLRGIYYLPAKTTFVSVEGHPNEFHYEVEGAGSFDGSATTRRFARFGEREDLIARLGVDPARGLRMDKDDVSEVVQFQANSRRSPYYGFPLWVSATTAMELEQTQTQFLFDFYFNGGVPDALMTLIGAKISDPDWKQIKQTLENNVGMGNRRRVMLLNLHQQGLEATFQKLGAEINENQVAEQLSLMNALKVVTAHRVPPLLAGIQIPGKMGAANEMSNAIMAFQTLVVSQDQRHFSHVLANTYGDLRTNGGLATRKKSFLAKGNGFNTIIDEIDLGTMDTVGRMRTSVSEAQARGRDLSRGVAERGSDIRDGRGERG